MNSMQGLVPARFRSQEQAPAAPLQQVQLHPKAADFLNHTIAVEADNEELRRQVNALTVENATLVYKLNFTQAEYDKVAIQRDELRAAVNEMNIQIGIVTAQNINMAQSARQQAESAAAIGLKAIEAVKDRMLRVGIDPNAAPEEEAPGFDDGVAAMGKRYGAGFDDQGEPETAAKAA